MKEEHRCITEVRENISTYFGRVDKMLAAYRIAVDNKYRVITYDDMMLLE